MLVTSRLAVLRGATALGCLMTTVLVGGCRDRGCERDTDCKGARVCDSGKCVDAKPASSVPAASAAPPPLLSASGTPSVAASASAAPPCAECRTQEDFDAAANRGRKCCPVTACRQDADCERGRVCCRIPDGQLCADAPRCARSDRVRSLEERCLTACPSGRTSRCFCACMGDCKEE